MSSFEPVALFLFQKPRNILATPLPQAEESLEITMARLSRFTG